MSPDNDQSLLTVVAGTYLCLHIRCPRGKTLNPPPTASGHSLSGGNCDISNLNVWLRLSRPRYSGHSPALPCTTVGLRRGMTVSHGQLVFSYIQLADTTDAKHTAENNMAP